MAKKAKPEQQSIDSIVTDFLNGQDVKAKSHKKEHEKGDKPLKKLIDMTDDEKDEWWSELEAKQEAWRQNQTKGTNKGTGSQPSFNYTGGTGTTPTQPVYVSCRHDPTPVFEIDGVTYHGASEANVPADMEADTLVVNLLGNLVVNDAMGFKATSNDPAIMALRDSIRSSHTEISIRWPDMKAPWLIQPDFWTKLHKLAFDKGFKKVVFFCVGGHGRTGTALASTLTANTDNTGEEAVEFIRKEYCDRAVETEKQAAYVDHIHTATR